MDNCFQLQIRRFFGFGFVPAEFDLPPFQLSVPEISGAFVEGPHNDKDASTFVLIFCTPFIPHIILIHFFDFGNNTIKLDKCHTNQGVLANHRRLMQTDRRQDGQRGQRDREPPTSGETPAAMAVAG